MPSKTLKTIKPTALLSDIRRDVSFVLGRPYTERIDHRLFQPDKRILALWAADCAERVLGYFEQERPGDVRPHAAIDACRQWATSGVFRMTDIRKASLDAHAAAISVKGPDAIFAAHAAGHAVATAHVPTHALGCSVYAIRAVAAHCGNMDDGIIRERKWQLECLRRYAADRDSS
ncbi:MAG: hypothetical protein GX651_01020 [Methanomicrobiales archaeon]|nr:hypothetical protein [Methanomicrobiales archaeon]